MANAFTTYKREGDVVRGWSTLRTREGNVALRNGEETIRPARSDDPPPGSTWVVEWEY